MGVRRDSWATVLLAVAALLVTTTPAGAQARELDYVALGDSAAAGPLIPHQDPNIACLRSHINYPQVAAEELGARLSDRTCWGATVADFSQHQHGFLPPQYEALSDETDLVTVTIGGNDVALVPTALSCVNLLPEPVGTSCADTSNGELAAAIEGLRPTFDGMLDEIHRRAPHAQVVLIGYGTYLRPGGCYPIQPVWARDADYLQHNIDRLSGVLAEAARDHGDEYVDLSPISRGHDTCAPIEQRYFEGLVPTSFAAPLHPNARGMAAFGHAVAEAVRAQDSSAA